MHALKCYCMYCGINMKYMHTEMINVCSHGILNPQFLIYAFQCCILIIASLG